MLPALPGRAYFDHEMKGVRRMSDHNTSNLLTLNDVADALAVSNLTARRIIRRGRLRHSRREVSTASVLRISPHTSVRR